MTQRAGDLGLGLSPAAGSSNEGMQTARPCGQCRSGVRAEAEWQESSRSGEQRMKSSAYLLMFAR